MIIGGVGVVGIYMMAYEFAGTRVALFSGLATVLSFWYIVHSRIGSSPQMLSPVLVAWTLYFFLRFRHTKKALDGVIGVLLSGLGIVSYPALIVLPLVSIGILLLQQYKIKIVSTKKLIVVVVVGLAIPVLLFLLIFINGAYAGTRGYLLTKMQTTQSPSAQVQTTLSNIRTTAGSLFVRGDQTFRINIPGRALLDAVSRALFLIGLVVLFFPNHRPKLVYILVPLILLPIPSILPTIPAGEIPSSGRMLGIAPVVFLLVGLGLSVVFRYFKTVGIIAVMGLIAWINLTAYFFDYPKGLPQNNSPYGRIIAEYIDSLPPQTHIYLTDCCWGAWGIPEPKSIYYQLKNQNGRDGIYNDPFIKTCEEVTQKPALIVFRPTDAEKMQSFEECFPQERGVLHKDSFGQNVFASLFIF